MRESPLQLGASVVSWVSCFGVPLMRPVRSTGTTHNVLANTKAMRVPSGDQVGPSSPRVPSERFGNTGVYVAAPVARSIKEVTPVALSSSTPGAWFRYTLDGTTPTRTNGYVYCGVISVRPGMTVKAIGYKSGMADSAVVDATYTLDWPISPVPPGQPLPKR